MTILQSGQQLGPYQVEGLLGTGGMAEVYRAVHQTLERAVAIKVINPAFNADPTFPLRFLREAKAVARLSHPHIITVYDFGEQGRLAYLVMELAEGGTFRERAAAIATLSQAVEELAPIADALGYAHSKGIVHRDLKPINLLLTQEQRLLLADFGLARVAAESLDLEGLDEGMILGTPNYMAPEQVLGGDVDQRADIYAFGILTYEVLAGELPYTGSAAVVIMQQQLAAPPPSIRAVIPEAPALLDRAILRATAKRPADRYDTPDEFLADLRSAALQAPDLPIGKARTGTPRAGSTRAATPASAPPADPDDMPTLIMPHETVAAFSAPAKEEAEQAAELEESGAREWVRPLPRAPAQTAAPVALPAAAATPPAARTHRRASSFNELQWLTIGTALVVVVFINAIGLWLTRAGLAANSGNVIEGVNRYIYHHLGAFKSALTGLALLLATLAVFSMRTAIVDNHRISPQLYRKLRQYHRLVGYGAIMIAFAVGLLTCVGIFGFGTASPRAVLHSVLGSALLLTIVAKIAVVRYYPAQRRHLKLLGEGLLVLFFLVFATSTVPYLWSHLSGSSTSNPYYPSIGFILP